VLEILRDTIKEVLDGEVARCAVLPCCPAALHLVLMQCAADAASAAAAADLQTSPPALQLVQCLANQPPPSPKTLPMLPRVLVCRRCAEPSHQHRSRGAAALADP